MLYQEGWGVGRIKHSLTYSGGLSRSYVRTYAPARRYGFEGFSPYTRPAVVEVAEGIPFAALDRLRRAGALRAQGRDRAPRRQGGHRPRHAGLPQAPLPARRGAARSAAGPPGRATRATTVGAFTPSIPEAMSAVGETADQSGARALVYPLGPRPRTASCSSDARSRRGRTPRGIRASSSRTSAADGRIARVVDRLPHRPRMSVALRDVRPVAVHDPRRHARGRDSRPARPGPRRPSRDRRAQCPPQIKLYNAASFFDPRAVPAADYAAIAARLAGFDRVIVESHPALVGGRVRPVRGRDSRGSARGRDGPRDRPPRRARAPQQADDARPVRQRGRALGQRAVALRVFLLVSPPFVPRAEQDEWLARSVDFAFDCGAAVVSLIPTRPGNGALEALAAAGHFAPPTLADLERSLDLALGRVARTRLRRPLGSRAVRRVPSVPGRAGRTAAAHEPRAAHEAAPRLPGLLRARETA